MKAYEGMTVISRGKVEWVKGKDNEAPKKKISVKPPIETVIKSLHFTDLVCLRTQPGRANVHRNTMHSGGTVTMQIDSGSLSKAR